MTSLDWWIVAAYAVIAIAIGLKFARRASENTENFFVAGRSLPWIVAGTSMVATTFSSDTPLWVAGAVRSDGVAAIWLMWAGIFGTLATVFYFARLWRRSEALTEVEIIVQRYERGIVTHSLRVFKALFDGVFVNCIIMASVTLAMSKCPWATSFATVSRLFRRFPHLPSASIPVEDSTVTGKCRSERKPGLPSRTEALKWRRCTISLRTRSVRFWKMRRTFMPSFDAPIRSGRTTCIP